MSTMSTSLWPWLAVAGAGALHGLNPCTGWGLAALCGLRAGDARQALRALGPIALGHAASVAAVAVSVAVLGGSMAALAPLAGIAALAAFMLLWRQRRGGIAAGAFAAATLQGSGLMLVPALVPLCLGASPAREITASGSLTLALAAVGVHMAAMLATTGVAAYAAGAGLDALRGWPWPEGQSRHTDALVICGAQPKSTRDKQPRAEARAALLRDAMRPEETSRQGRGWVSWQIEWLRWLRFPHKRGEESSCGVS